MERARELNSRLWTGVLLTFITVAALVLFFVQFPGQTLLPWITLVLSAIAAFLVISGLRLARSQPQRYGGKTTAWIFSVVSVLLLAFNLFAFFAARHLPAPNGAPAAGQKAPEFVLKDTRGQNVSLAQLLSQPNVSSGGAAPKAVLLVFYRGYW
jgi:hypothetical protein